MVSSFLAWFLLPTRIVGGHGVHLYPFLNQHAYLSYRQKTFFMPETRDIALYVCIFSDQLSEVALKYHHFCIVLNCI